MLKQCMKRSVLRQVLKQNGGQLSHNARILLSAASSMRLDQFESNQVSQKPMFSGMSAQRFFSSSYEDEHDDIMGDESDMTRRSYSMHNDYDFNDFQSTLEFLQQSQRSSQNTIEKLDVIHETFVAKVDSLQTREDFQEEIKDLSKYLSFMTRAVKNEMAHDRQVQQHNLIYRGEFIKTIDHFCGKLNHHDLQTDLRTLTNIAQFLGSMNQKMFFYKRTSKREYRIQVNNFMNALSQYQKGNQDALNMDPHVAKDLFEHPSVNILNIARFANRMVDEFTNSAAVTYLVNHCQNKARQERDMERERGRSQSVSSQNEQQSDVESEYDDMSAASESEYGQDNRSKSDMQFSQDQREQALVQQICILFSRLAINQDKSITNIFNAQKIADYLALKDSQKHMDLRCHLQILPTFVRVLPISYRTQQVGLLNALEQTLRFIWQDIDNLQERDVTQMVKVQSELFNCLFTESSRFRRPLPQFRNLQNKASGIYKELVSLVCDMAIQNHELVSLPFLMTYTTNFNNLYGKGIPNRIVNAVKPSQAQQNALLDLIYNKLEYQPQDYALNSVIRLDEMTQLYWQTKALGEQQSELHKMIVEKYFKPICRLTSSTFFQFSEVFDIYQIIRPLDAESIVNLENEMIDNFMGLNESSNRRYQRVAIQLQALMIAEQFRSTRLQSDKNSQEVKDIADSVKQKVDQFRDKVINEVYPKFPEQTNLISVEEMQDLFKMYQRIKSISPEVNNAVTQVIDEYLLSPQKFRYVDFFSQFDMLLKQVISPKKSLIGHEGQSSDQTIETNKNEQAEIEISEQTQISEAAEDSLDVTSTSTPDEGINFGGYDGFVEYYNKLIIPQFEKIPFKMNNFLRQFIQYQQIEKSMTVAQQSFVLKQLAQTLENIDFGRSSQSVNNLIMKSVEYFLSEVERESKGGQAPAGRIQGRLHDAKDLMLQINKTPRFYDVRDFVIQAQATYEQLSNIQEFNFSKSKTSAQAQIMTMYQDKMLEYMESTDFENIDTNRKLWQNVHSINEALKGAPFYLSQNQIVKDSTKALLSGVNLQQMIQNAEKKDNIDAIIRDIKNISRYNFLSVMENRNQSKNKVNSNEEQPDTDVQEEQPDQLYTLTHSDNLRLCTIIFNKVKNVHEQIEELLNQTDEKDAIYFRKLNRLKSSSRSIILLLQEARGFNTDVMNQAYEKSFKMEIQTDKQFTNKQIRTQFTNEIMKSFYTVLGPSESLHMLDTRTVYKQFNQFKMNMFVSYFRLFDSNQMIDSLSKEDIIRLCEVYQKHGILSPNAYDQLFKCIDHYHDDYTCDQFSLFTSACSKNGMNQNELLDNLWSKIKEESAKEKPENVKQALDLIVCDMIDLQLTDSDTFKEIITNNSVFEAIYGEPDFKSANLLSLRYGGRLAAKIVESDLHNTQPETFRPFLTEFIDKLSKEDECNISQLNMYTLSLFLKYPTNDYEKELTQKVDFEKLEGHINTEWLQSMITNTKIGQNRFNPGKTYWRQKKQVVSSLEEYFGYDDINQNTIMNGMFVDAYSPSKNTMFKFMCHETDLMNDMLTPRNYVKFYEKIGMEVLKSMPREDDVEPQVLPINFKQALRSMMRNDVSSYLSQVVGMENTKPLPSQEGVDVPDELNSDNASEQVDEKETVEQETVEQDTNTQAQ